LLGYNSRMSSLDPGRKAGLRRELESLLGKSAVLSDPEELLVYESDGLTLFQALADFVVFLLSDRSGVVTGSVIDWDQNVSGGLD